VTGKSGPLARVAIKREKERQLRHDLWELRDAIRFATRIWPTRQKSRSRWAPKAPDLETLVEGVDVGGKRYRLLRRIPIDPMTNRIMQSLIAALAGWNVPFVCTETHELGRRSSPLICTRSLSTIGSTRMVMAGTWPSMICSSK